MARPKRQHYVTKAYLDGFLEPSEEQLFCWARPLGKLFRGKPENLAHERNYYSVRNPDGSWDDAAEELIGTSVEDPGLAVLKKLNSGKTRLNWRERLELSRLFAFQEFRVPFFRAAITQVDRELLTEILEHYHASTPKYGGSGKITLESRRGRSPLMSLRRNWKRTGWTQEDPA
jgi:hypothetical protein